MCVVGLGNSLVDGSIIALMRVERVDIALKPTEWWKL